MQTSQQLAGIAEYTKGQFAADATGHDSHHMQRVAMVAKKIAVEEGGNLFICEAAGWLHDIGDHKLFADPESAKDEMRSKLKQLGLDNQQIIQVEAIIESISFTTGIRTPETLEGRIVQDADRLDALGAIGIARTFAYGGAKGQLIYSTKTNETSSIQHFYDKLFHLTDQMHTQTAKKIAQKRHLFMEAFLMQLNQEWL